MSACEESHLEVPSPSCRNCGTALRGAYCHRCGQEDRDLDVRFRELAGEWLDSVFGLDARLWRTLRLLVRPGEASLRYLEGHRASLVSPLRLYLVASLLLFLVFSWNDSRVIFATGEDRPDSGVALSFSPPKDKAEELAGDEGPVSERSSFERFFGRIAEHIENDRRGFERTFREQAGKVAILLVPIFALLLRLLFRGAKRPYLHHLIFSLHVHAFAALAFALATLASLLPLVERIGNFLVGTTYLGVLAYLFLALRRFYQEGRIKTGVKLYVLLFAHSLALLAVLFGALTITIWVLG